jgi:hypothetical protein
MRSKRDSGVRRMEGAADIGVGNCVSVAGRGSKIQSTVVRNSGKSRSKSPFCTRVALSVS